MAFHETTERLRRLRDEMVARNLEGLLVPRFDAHQGEVVAAHDERLAYISNFSGSAGIALVTRDRAILFVDGRYQIQVRQEADLEQFEIAHFYDAPLDQWLADNATIGGRYGVNAMLVPPLQFEKLAAVLDKRQASLIALDEDLVDCIWKDQPEPPLAPIQFFPESFSGETSLSKRQRVATKLRKSNASLLVETQPDNIAWLLNVRGGDVVSTPIPHSFLIAHVDGQIDWFVDSRKLPNDRQGFEDGSVTIRKPADFLCRLSEVAAGQSIWVDPDFSPAAVTAAIKSAGGTIVSGLSPLTDLKALKNPIELQGFRDAHLQDGIALTEFSAWLALEVPQREAAGKPLTELEAEAKILAFRAMRENFKEPSFRSISAADSNAAMCHYSSSPQTDKPIGTKTIYLLDSGGQYLSGTTDVTRTFAFSDVPAIVRQTHTAVLQGFIALITAQFPNGTMGHQLDALARKPLWDLGLDYDHGTGHGVGHYLTVHEHPHRFAKKANNAAIQPGVVMTIEPGYYREGEFGLRVENQVEVVESLPGYLTFKSLTLSPIDLSLADLSLLSAREKQFLNLYHAEVRERLTPHLSAQALQWMERKTQPIS
jgi:Xaa-Pro aminopeptidase